MDSSAAKPETDASRRLRILAILNGSIRGYSGGDLHTIAVLKEWARDHEVELLLPNGSSPEVASLVTPQVKVLGSPSQSQHPSRQKYLFWVLARMLAAVWYVSSRRGRWDVVIASSHFAFDAVPMLITRGGSGRGLYWWHHASAPIGRPGWTHILVRLSETFLVRLVARSQVRVLTGNSQTRSWLESNGLSPAAITLTRNGPSFMSAPESSDKVFSSEPRLEGLVGRRFVLFCARLSNLKGAADLPAISRHVLEAASDAAIVLCGTEGPEGAAVHRALDSYEQAGSVMFLGFVTELVKQWLFEHAHVLIAPSYEEGWGAAVTDGVTSGCWVVTYDLPAVRESCPDGPVFVPLGDVQLFSRATAACLGRSRPTRRPEGATETWKRIAQSDLEAITGGRETDSF